MGQLGLLPELDREAPVLFTARERILQDFAQENKLDPAFVKEKSQSMTLTM